MNRRELLAALLAIPSLMKAEIGRENKIGFLDMARHGEFRARGIFFHVLLDGRDVTDRCYEADDSKGVVRLRKHDSDGRAYLNSRGDVANETRTGHVEFRPGVWPPLSE